MNSLEAKIKPGQIALERMFPEVVRVLGGHSVLRIELRDNSPPGPIAGQKAGPEAVRSVRGDGVVRGGEESQVQAPALLSGLLSQVSTARHH